MQEQVGADAGLRLPYLALLLDRTGFRYYAVLAEFDLTYALLCFALLCVALLCFAFSFAYSCFSYNIPR